METTVVKNSTGRIALDHLTINVGFRILPGSIAQHPHLLQTRSHWCSRLCHRRAFPKLQNHFLMEALLRDKLTHPLKVDLK